MFIKLNLHTADYSTSKMRFYKSHPHSQLHCNIWPLRKIITEGKMPHREYMWMWRSGMCITSAVLSWIICIRILMYLFFFQSVWWMKQIDMFLKKSVSFWAILNPEWNFRNAGMLHATKKHKWLAVIKNNAFRLCSHNYNIFFNNQLTF